LPTTSRWKTFYLEHLAKPVADRIAYQAILRQKLSRIVELGVGDGTRALRMIDAAARHTERQNIHYFGLDPFEDRTSADGPGLSLIEAYRLLRPSEAKIKLLPGDPCQMLVRSANTLSRIDLLLISGREVEQLQPVWFFVPRMLHERSIVLLESADSHGEKTFRHIEKGELAGWASDSRRRKAA
jgi:hypothetical protein